MGLSRYHDLLNVFYGCARQYCMSGTIQVDSPPLTDEGISDIEDFYSHSEDHKVGTLKELLEKLHSD